jgi:hypothetical protein
MTLLVQMLNSFKYSFPDQGLEAFFEVYPIFVVCLFILFIILAIINRKIFVNIIKAIPKRTFLALFLIIAVFSIVCTTTGLNFKFFNASDAEWMELNAAEKLAQNNFEAQLQDRMTFPVMLAFIFKLFGINPFVVSVLNLILGIISIILVFLLSQILFQNTKISLISSTIYALTPLTLTYTSFLMGDPSLVSVFVLLFSFFTILAFRYHSLSLHTLSLVGFFLLSYTKLEYFVLIICYLFYFLLIKEYKKLSFKKIVVLIILFILFSLPYFAGYSHFKKFNINEWCGFPSQPFHDSQWYSYQIPVFAHIDKIIHFFINSRFSLSYLIYDLGEYVRFWFSHQLFLISCISLIGAIIFFRKNKFESTIIFTNFFIMNAVYLADCINYEPRLAFPLYGIIIIYSGLAIYFLATQISNFIRSKYLINLFTICLMIFIIFCWYFKPLGQHKLVSFTYYHTFVVNNNYGIIKNIISVYRISPQKSYIWVPHHSDKYILKFLGYKTDELGGMVNIDYYRDKNHFCSLLDLSCPQLDECYFISNWHCDNGEIGDMCRCLLEKYHVKPIEKFEDNYTLYKLK